MRFNLLASLRDSLAAICLVTLSIVQLTNAYGQPSAPLDAFKRVGIPLEDVTLYAIGVDQVKATFEHRSEAPFILASTTKIATSLAALDILGPAFRWRTQAFVNGSVFNQILSGDLLLVGGADPLLSSESLVTWFKQIQKRGFKEIVGNIILDRHRFEFGPKDHANTPLPDWRNGHHVLPDAFVVDEGLLRMEVRQTPKGKEIQLSPEIEGVEILDRSTLLNRCASIKVPLSIEFEESAGRYKLTLDGQWAPDCQESRIEIAPLDQIQFSSAAVLAAWKKAGGSITGTVVEAPQPAKIVPSKKVKPKGNIARPRKPYASIESKQLFDTLKQVNKWSHNLMARHLLLSLSENFPNKPANIASAQRAIAMWLEGRGLKAEDIQIDNGSGLSRTEKGKSRALAHLLQEAWASRIDQAFKNSLSIVGVDGTMGARLKRSGAAGKALIKTGTLSDTRAIAGYVTSRSGQSYVIVGIVNHPNAWRAIPALDHFIEWVYEH